MDIWQDIIQSPTFRLARCPEKSVFGSSLVDNIGNKETVSLPERLKWSLSYAEILKINAKSVSKNVRMSKAMKKDPHLGSPAEEEGNTADTLRHPGPVAGVVEGRAAAINGFHVLCSTTASTSGLLRKQILVEDLAVEDGRRPGRLSVGAGRC